MGARLEGVEGVRRYISASAKKLTHDYIEILRRVGNQTVSAIKKGEASNWNDISHNLRASVGFIIVHDGVIKASRFELHDGKGKEGIEEGRTFAQELAKKFPSGFVLIIVAGMEYAAYVEAIEGKVVLTDGAKLAKRLYKELMDKYNAQYGK